MPRDRLRPEKLRTAGVIGCEVIVLDEVGSTNDVLTEMAAGDWPEGLCVFAEQQTAGRGQRGNHWESAAGKGLWFSVLLHPHIAIKDSPRLSAWAAGMVAEMIERVFDLPATVKLPNDVYVADRKIAGVLVEMRARTGASHAAIVGIGVNVNHAISDFSAELRHRATSLAILQGRPLDRQSLAVELLRNLDRTYEELFK
jgi:BirA family biotin operon repressor/biotin-[acetyl-CoA-carboxylase] ligase